MTCWDLSSLYESEQQWQEEAERIVAEAQRIRANADVSTDAVNLLEMRMELVHLYAYLRHQEKMFAEKNIELLDKAEAWIDRMYEHLAEYFERTRKESEEVLDETQAEAIRHIESTMSTYYELYSAFVNGDLKCTPIPDSEGNLHEVTEGNYLDLLMSTDRELRKNAYNEMVGSYGKFGHTLTGMLIAYVKANVMLAQQKGDASVLECTLKEEGLSRQVYDNLIESVKANVQLLHRLHAFRSQQVGQSQLHWFDLFHSVVPGVSFQIPYEQAHQLVVEALSILGPEYLTYVRAAFEQQWIDVWPREGKTPGAFTVGAYRSHPFISLNYTESLDDVCTLAHEMGHAVHMMLYQENQPYLYSDSSTFIKEVAALVNEHLLVEQWIRRTDHLQERAFLLNFSLEQFRGKVIRQTCNAEFERDLYDLIESGEATTYEAVGERYANLLAGYYGPHLVTDEALHNEWLRVRHFYHPFYLYSYPLGFLIAATIAKQILDEENNMREKYMLFLKSGSSLEPTLLLKTLGIDLHSPDTFQSAFVLMEQRLEELERVVGVTSR